MRPSRLLAAWCLDWVMGDPPWLPHPVRLIGALIAAGDKHLYVEAASDRGKLVAGAALTAGVVTMVYAGTRSLLAGAERLGPWAGAAAEVVLAASCLASRDLHGEATAVLIPLRLGDLPQARTRLARIVGRDTGTLDRNETSRALIETLAESANDGVLAPLFFLCVGSRSGLGAVPVAMAFKAVSTLDSMIGHRTERYLFFGRTAARLDDLALLLPARFTALAIAALAPRGRGRVALRVFLRDGSAHASPNAGQPEAAMAGALGVRLGGRNTYNGEPIEGPPLGGEFRPPEPRDAERALWLTAGVSLVGLGLGLFLARSTQTE